MSAAKTATRAEAREIEGGPPPFIVEGTIDADTLRALALPGSISPVHDISEGLNLLRWIAERIVVRNQNGRRSDKLCLLCKEARRRREPCRHGRIWELAGVKPQRA